MAETGPGDLLSELDSALQRLEAAEAELGPLYDAVQTASLQVRALARRVRMLERRLAAANRRAVSAQDQLLAERAWVSGAGPRGRRVTVMAPRAWAGPDGACGGPAQRSRRGRTDRDQASDGGRRPRLRRQLMTPDDHERELRRRLAAYVSRQTARAAAYDRLTSAAKTEPQFDEPSPSPPAPAPAPAPPGPSPAAAAPGRGYGSEPDRVTVVVPIHDAPEELRACLWSLARNTTRAATLLLIDDASVDPRVDDLLAWAVTLENVRVLRNVQNLGFAATINRGLRASQGDVVLLNSDTVVGPRWLEQLRLAAHTGPNTGTVTPLSDNAGAFSAPVVDVANRMPVRLGPDDVARLVAAAGGAVNPHAPTGNGFCLYLRRALIEAVGEFDSVSFPRGYGEETDYCMRAGRLGWEHVVDDRTFVHHRRAASFGAARSTLIAAARQRMEELHPDYPAKVASFIADQDMQTARRRVAQALARGEREAASRPRLLFVIHEGGGGAVATNRDLMGALGGEYDCLCFSSDRHVLRLRRIEGSSNEVLDEWPLKRPLLLADFSRADYREAFSAALDRAAPEIVHIRHLFKHTFDAPRMAAARELTTVMSFHDHYFICPTIHLLDERGRYCGGDCTPGLGHCPTVRAGSLPPLKHAFVHQWREEVEVALGDVDAFVTSSSYTRDIHRRFLRATRSRRFELIEHGRNLTQLDGLSEAPERGGRIRILVPGHLDRHKGADLLAAMSRLDREGRLELHFVGDVPERYRRLGVIHGAYERDDLAARVQEIRPAFVGVFSVTGESYSHAITEAWAAGVPVLATDLGAQAARVTDHGGGFLVSAHDPAAALAQVLAAADNRAAYAREQARSNIATLPDVDEMACGYTDLYRDVVDRRRQFAAPHTRPTSPLARGVWRLTAVSTPPGSPAARRLTHPGMRWKLRTRICSATGSRPGRADLVLVGAESLAPGEARSLVAELRERGTPLVLLVDRAPGGEDTPGGADGAREVLLRASRLVIVPGAALARIYSRRHGHVAVLAPALDERLFLAAGGSGPPPSRELEPAEPVHLAYVDPRPGTQQLELLRAALEQLNGAAGRRYQLDVATSADLEPGAGWYELVRIPDPEQAYAEYAQRLRELSPRWHAAVMPQLGVADGDLRYLECAALGLPGVYGATEERAIRDEVEGLVCAAEIPAWCEAIGRLATDAALGETIRQGAWRSVTEARLMAHGGSAALEVLGQALDAPPPASASAAPVAAAPAWLGPPVSTTLDQHAG